MHASIEQLLELRDKRPVAVETLLHLEGCVPCRQRLDGLGVMREALRTLPEEPVPDLWPAIRARLKSQGTLRSTTIAHYGRWAALAASTVLITALAVTMKLRQETTTLQNASPPAVAVTTNSAPPRPNVIAADPVLSSADTALAELVSRSNELEATLRALPGRRSVMRAGTAATIMGLEDGVALIDYSLTREARQLDAVQSRQLWQRRVDLLNSLVNVRYAEVQPAAYYR